MPLFDSSGVIHISVFNTVSGYYEIHPYSNKFPGDVLQLHAEGSLFSIPLLSGNLVKLSLGLDLKETANFKRPIFRHLFVPEGDSVVVLSHLDFTQLFATRRNLSIYEFADDSYELEVLQSGWYLVEVFYREIDFDLHEAEVEVAIRLTPTVSNPQIQPIHILEAIDID